MKTFKTQLTIVLVALAVSLNACVESSINKFSSKKFIRHYKDHENVISFNLPPALLRVFVDREEKELKELLRHMDDMRFLIFEEEYFQKGSAKALFENMDKELTASNFQDLMIVKEKDQHVKFKVLEYEGKVKEMIMLVASDDGMVLMNISGNIDLSEMSIITENFDVNKVYDFD